MTATGVALVTEIIPIALGYFATSSANKDQAIRDNMAFAIEELANRHKSTDLARVFSKSESIAGQWFRRAIVLILLSFIMMYILMPIFGIDLIIATEIKESFLGLFTSEHTEYETIKGLFKFEEIFSWVAIIIEFYFGGQLAKVR